jgi:phage terminase Nu1 subunit (DNA packaging protein)
VSELERYVDARELAQLMGVSVRTVNRLTVAGMPSETWGMSRTRRYRPSEALEWARSRAYDGSSPGSRPQRTRITSQLKE